MMNFEMYVKECVDNTSLTKKYDPQNIARKSVNIYQNVR